jgi:hypothetical protein
MRNAVRLVLSPRRSNEASLVRVKSRPTVRRSVVSFRQKRTLVCEELVSSCDNRIALLDNVTLVFLFLAPPSSRGLLPLAFAALEFPQVAVDRALARREWERPQ